MSTATRSPSAKPGILRPWQTSVLVLIVLVVIASVYGSTRSKAEVRVIHPAYQEIESSVSTAGTVVPMHDFPARANFTGLVENIYVHLGENAIRYNWADPHGIPYAWARAR